MDSLLPLGLVPPSDTVEKKRGRPKGARNKASSDLAKFIAARSGGVTPGQQISDLVMVTPKDIREGRKRLAELGLDAKRFTPMMVGYWYRRANLMALFGWTEEKADAVMAKMLDILMPYVHQSQGKVEPEKVDTTPAIYASSMHLGALGNPSQGLDIQGEITFEPMPLTHDGSHTSE